MPTATGRLRLSFRVTDENTVRLDRLLERGHIILETLNGRLQFRLVLRIVSVQVGGAAFQTVGFRLQLGHEGLLLRLDIAFLLLQLRLVFRLRLHLAAEICQLLLARSELVAERFFLRFSEYVHSQLFYSVPLSAASSRPPSSSDPLLPFLPIVDSKRYSDHRHFFLKRLHRLRE